MLPGIAWDKTKNIFFFYLFLILNSIFAGNNNFKIKE
jgi:hypothetical protein